jgi:hypothetical protein
LIGARLINSLSVSDNTKKCFGIGWYHIFSFIFVFLLAEKPIVFIYLQETVIQEHAQSDAQCTELAQSAVSHLESLLSADPGLSPEKILVAVDNSLQQFMNSEQNLHESICSGVVVCFIKSLMFSLNFDSESFYLQSEAEVHEILQRSNESIQKFSSLVQSIHSNLLAQQNPSSNAFPFHSNSSPQCPDPQQYINNCMSISLVLLQCFCLISLLVFFS